MSTKKVLNKDSSKRDIAKESFWREAISNQEKSGETVRSFCRSNKLSWWSFYDWRRKIRKRDKEDSSAAQFAAINLPSAVSSNFGNTKLSGSEVEINLSCGNSLRAGSNVPLERISGIVKIINA